MVSTVQLAKTAYSPLVHPTKVYSWFWWIGKTTYLRFDPKASQLFWAEPPNVKYRLSDHKPRISNTTSTNVQSQGVTRLIPVLVVTKGICFDGVTHWEFFFLLPVLADGRRLGAPSVHSVVRVIIYVRNNGIYCESSGKSGCSGTERGHAWIAACPYLDIQVYRELARTKQKAWFTWMFGCEAVV